MEQYTIEQIRALNLYGVEFHNMRSGYHGLFVFNNVDNATSFDNTLTTLTQNETYIELELFLEKVFAEPNCVGMTDFIEEIDFRNDISFDERLEERVWYDGYNDPVVIVNENHIVHSIYGL